MGTSTVTVHLAMLLMKLCVWILPVLRESAAEVTCEFPQFLQSPETDGELQAWNTRRWWLHLRHKPKWAEKQEVYVRGSHIWCHREQSLKTCERKHKRRSHPLVTSSLQQCTEKQLVYNRTCISIQGYAKYRVLQYNHDRTHSFTCMRFVRRSDNIVQVYQGTFSESNDDDLCDDDHLSLDEWPWVAPWQTTPYFCPINGGFTFRTIRRLTNEDFCESEWRRSHLEIECVRGDGLHFMTPADAECNPFEKHGHFKRLNCWAGWEEGEFIFLVAADHNEPRYCLRFPKQQHGEFSVLVYFSVICPTENDGKPPHGIEYYELRMRRKDVLPCEDEHALHCKEIAENNKCSRDHDFARHCPRSCGLCEDKTEVEKKDRCWFDPRLYGDWILYERERTEDVFIDRYSLSFSQLGDFTCTDVISENDYRYKTISTFKNGCSDRYTCFEFKRRNNNVLQFRVGKSHRKDGEPETICHFDKDSSPLRDRYRSLEFKNLILARDLWPSYCGLNSNIPFNGTVNGEQCEGELGDWSPDTCTTRGTLVFRSSTCTSLIIPQEFQCLAFIPADEGSLQQQLITRSMDGKNEYNCWVINSHIEGPRWPYRIMYRMPTTQCPESPETASGAGMLPKATLYLDDKSRSKVCYPDQDNPASTQGTSTRSTDIKYVIPEQNNGNKDVHIGSQRPQADGSSPTPASGLSQGAAQSCCPSWVLTCALSVVAALTMASLSNIGMTSKWVPSDVTSFSSRR